jgi:hypothetical protein
MTTRFQPIFSLALLLMAAMLSGCFFSDKPLISLNEAEFPFQTVTYEFPGEDDRVTLVRTGDAYTAPDEGGDGKLILKELAPKTYLLQVEFDNGGKPGFLFAIARLAADEKSALLIKPFAMKVDQDAARRGEHGFRPCADDPDMVCLSALQAYVDYALAADQSESKSIHILELK